MSSEFFDFAQKSKLAIFPCAQGTKRPTLKWKTGSTYDRAQWVTWQSQHNNLAIDCAKSGIVVIDVDSSKVTREEAWKAYCALCADWGLPEPAPPMTQSARGGWHIPFRRPTNLAATDLRGGGTLLKISDIRALAEGEEDGEVVGFKNRGYCVAPGSTLSTAAGDLLYVLMPEAPAPHDAPDGLIEAIKLKVVEATCGQTGTSDKADVAKLVAELDMFGEFSTEPDWFRCMGAIKLALGDTEDAVEVALQMTTDDATAEAFSSRWNRLASVDDGGPKYRIKSMIHRYKELTGKHFNVRTSVEAMFNGVAQLVGAGMPSIPTVEAPPIAPDMPVQLSADEQAKAVADALDALPDMFRNSGEFTNGFVPPDYLVDTILQRGFLYSLTAQTGVGKTTVAMRLAAHVATERPFCGHDVQRGTVLYFAGENPTDIQMRWLGLTKEMRLDPKTLDVHFTYGPNKLLPEVIARITREVARKSLTLAAIVIDTAAAHFTGDLENDNDQNGNYARQLRSLCMLPGTPCVLVLCHPTKGAQTIDQMVPRGGGAFLNEVDGNVGLVRNAAGVLVASAVGKFRGPEFVPLNFALKVINDHPLLKDSGGRQIPTIVADPISYDEVKRREATTEKDEIKVLRFIGNNPRASLEDIGTAIFGPKGKSKAQRIVGDLTEAKRVVYDKIAGIRTLAPAVQKSLNALDSAVSATVSGAAIVTPFPLPTRPQI
ncbi:hypothetical protein BSZ19_02640 [Bradyrhizobium japonicum]|uniref:DNA primase/polymerase bifunctional N-terminal domain-containing protein n=1 Tax=Bradyrhizobium japonicum TaxID=375 RepID=A0A1Y2JX80_BRAJP|nr:AAA family ATPase [Bradyrhizobium japonicum]OSJ36761.1 hypothetical protein BSZ19_02640 [Bradyrhizobium japonicum]